MQFSFLMFKRFSCKLIKILSVKKYRMDGTYWKRVLVMMLTMFSVFIVFELYVPLKRFILGDTLTLYDVLDSINLKRYIISTFLSSIVFGFISGDVQSKS